MEPSQIIWPLILIAVAAAQVVIALAMIRRTPPLPEQLAKEYVTKNLSVNNHHFVESDEGGGQV